MLLTPWPPHAAGRRGSPLPDRLCAGKPEWAEPSLAPESARLRQDARQSPPPASSLAALHSRPEQREPRMRLRPVAAVRSGAAATTERVGAGAGWSNASSEFASSHRVAIPLPARRSGCEDKVKHELFYA